ncbi:MAG: WbqC family protein [Paraglaciecola sp.]|uniref:WbqC family protein n=1 Tax=Paraglaciecola sp. TaxID=1920173 RepID=UPI0032990115
MILAVMQPYLFPYLGYYQLAYHSDKFIFYDDVNFIKGGYINRNNILTNGQKQLFTVPVEKASSFTKINELHFAANRKKVIKTIEQNYRKAPHFEAVMPVISQIFASKETQVAQLCSNSVLAVFNYLAIELDYSFSSELDYDKSASAAEKLYAMCSLNNADKYCNMKNGEVLYKKEQFKANNIELSFLEMGDVAYHQGKHEFVSHLSIIDVLMWNSIDEVKSLLQKYVIS